MWWLRDSSNHGFPLPCLRTLVPSPGNGRVGKALWDPFGMVHVELVGTRLILLGPSSPLQAENQGERWETIKAFILEQRFSVWAASQNHLGGFKVPSAEAALQTKMSECLRLGSG